ncbi:MAG: hypothetical protein ABUS48_01600 [Pseudomonadota bacterium]
MATTALTYRQRFDVGFPVTAIALERTPLDPLTVQLIEKYGVLCGAFTRTRPSYSCLGRLTDVRV